MGRRRIVRPLGQNELVGDRWQKQRSPNIQIEALVELNLFVHGEQLVRHVVGENDCEDLRQKRFFAKKVLKRRFLPAKQLAIGIGPDGDLSKFD